MCANYWTIKKAKLICKKCKKTSIWTDIQTHFMGGGDNLICVDYYELGEKIKALGDLTITLDGKNDDFISSCPECKKFADIGAKIKHGKVIKMRTLN